MDLSELNVILIDDNESDLDVALEAFEKFAFVKVKSFTDSERAYTFLQKEYSFDAKKNSLIILDLNIPKKNGLELLKEIKSNPVTSRHPVIIYTSSTRKEDQEKAYALGAASYVIKPTNIDEVEKTFGELAHYWAKASMI